MIASAWLAALPDISSNKVDAVLASKSGRDPIDHHFGPLNVSPAGVRCLRSVTRLALIDVFAPSSFRQKATDSPIRERIESVLTEDVWCLCARQSGGAQNSEGG